MSEASDQITEYLSVGGLFNPEMMNQTQHEAVRDTLIKARDDIQRLERWNAALREQVEELDAKWKMAEDQCFDQVGKIGELERENAKLRNNFMFAESEIILLREDREELREKIAALREMLINADELERYSGSDGRRQWGKCSTWLHADDVVIIVSAKAFDAIRKEAQ